MHEGLMSLTDFGIKIYLIIFERGNLFYNLILSSLHTDLYIGL